MYWVTADSSESVKIGTIGDDGINGDDGNDTLLGFGGDDILAGGKGNDVLHGGYGNDIYVFGRGDGHDIVDAFDESNGKFDMLRLRELAPDEVEVSINNLTDIVVMIRNTGETITILNGYASQNSAIQAIEFGNGNVVSWRDVKLTDIIGTDQNDSMIGNNGGGVLYGMDGDDTLSGGSGDDFLEGGKGNDEIAGGLGNDIFVYSRGDGNDVIDAYDLREGKRDILFLKGLARDEIEFACTRDGDAIVRVKDSGTTVTIKNGMRSSEYGIQAVKFGDGSLLEWRDIYFHDLWGDGGNNSLTGGDLNDSIYGLDGNDSLNGNAGNDLLDGGAGNDSLVGGSGNDVFVFGRGYGHDVADAFDPNSQKYDIIRLIGLSRSDVDFKINEEGDLIIRIKDTGETLTAIACVKNNAYRIQGIEFGDGSIHGMESLDIHGIWGSENSDELNGGEESEAIFGLEGDDDLSGGSGNDVLQGGVGNDRMTGGTGNDVFVFGRGDGHDVVIAFDETPEKHDIIRLEGLTPSEVAFERNYNGDVIIRICDTNETLTILGALKNFSNAVQAIEFADGSILDFTDISFNTTWGSSESDFVRGGQAEEHLYGLEGNDRLEAGDGDDVLNGGLGNDFLIGGGGDDVFVFGRGDGHDVIDAFECRLGKKDSIRLRDLGQNDVEYFIQDHKDFVIRIKDTGETITVQNGIKNNLYAISMIEFADGTITNPENIPVVSHLGNDQKNTLTGGVGDDYLFGSGGDDTLSGGKGNDRLEGGMGNDTLNNDEGNDVFIFGRGDGHDIISGRDTGAGKRDFIKLIGLCPNEIEMFVSNQYNFGIRIKDTGETITIQNGLKEPSYGIQAIEFGDGTVWEWTEVLKQPLIMLDAAANIDFTIPFDSGIVFGNNLNNRLTGSAGDDILYGQDGNDTLSGNAGNDVLDGGLGNDILNGGAGNDIFVFTRGGGNDTINASDTGANKRDVINLYGLNPDEVEFFAANVYDFGIRIKDTGETITVTNGLRGASYGIQAIEFGDGTVWEWTEIVKNPIYMLESTTQASVVVPVEGAFIVGNSLNNNISGTAQTDILHGEGGNDTLTGNAGDDILWDGTGNDTLNGGEGNDIYLFNRGDGNDIVNESGTTGVKRNIIRFEEGIEAADIEFSVKNSSSSYMDLIIRIKGTGDTLTIKNALSGAYANNTNAYSIQAIEFSDGTVWELTDILDQPMKVSDTGAATTSYAAYEGSRVLGTISADTMNGGASGDILSGGAGNDTLNGNSGNDVLHGGIGNDVLTGGLGDDTYLFNRDDGADIINESETRANRRNIVKFGAEIADTDIEFLTKFSSSNYMDLIIRLKGTNDTLTIKNAFSNGYANVANAYSIQAIQFNDGTVWNWSDILAKPMQVIESAAPTNVYTAVEGSYVIGNATNEAITGGAGNDTLCGGGGNDTLRGGNGDDVYLFRRGDGSDLIVESETRIGRRNIIRLGEGIGADDIEFMTKTYSGQLSNLIIRIKDTGESLTIQGAISGNTLNAQNVSSIQAIEFADGTKWEWSSILLKSMYMADSSTATTIYTAMEGSSVFGGSGVETIYGGNGNDVIYGGGGADNLHGNAGNDVLSGGSGNDTLNGGVGDDVYLFGRGDGHDVINETETRANRRNVIRIREGLGINDIELCAKMNGNSTYTHLVVRIKDTGETLTVYNGLRNNVSFNAANSYSIQAIEFADGTVWEWQDILQQPIHVIEGTNIGGAAEGTFLMGSSVSETLNGQSGTDTLYGGVGNDTLYGNGGNDILWGGAGNDRQEGGVGDDVYIFGRGDGHDTIYESETRADRKNVIRLREGLDVNDIELCAKMNGNSSYTDLVVRIKDTGETLTVNYGLRFSNLSNTANSNSIQAIEFADGTTWNWNDIVKQPIHVIAGTSIGGAAEGTFLMGSSTNETFYGQSSADTLHGGAGDDTLYGNVGNDTLWGV